MAAPDPLVTPLAEELLACLDQEVAKVDNPPEQVCLRVGDVVPLLLSTLDDECCRGLAWVRAVTFFPTDGLFEQQVVPSTGGVGPLGWIVELEMGVGRCAPTPPASQLITCDQWTTLTEEVYDDAAAMRRAFCCFLENHRGQTVAGVWTPLPVEGRCAGGTMTVQVRGPECDCEEAGPSS